VTRVEKDGRPPSSDRYEGKDSTAPTILFYRSEWNAIFTDPPFGLPKFYDDPAKSFLQRGLQRQPR
jgi:gluconolactonase